MKQLLLLFGTLTMLALAPTVQADGRYGYGYDRHPGYYGGNHYRGRGYYRGNHYGRYKPHYYRPGSSVHLSFGRHYYHDHFSTGSFVGGLVLGSVLSHAVRPRYRETRYYGTPVHRPSSVTVVRRTPVVSRSVSERRLLRDLSGRCFEITRSSGGREIRTEIESSACNF